MPLTLPFDLAFPFLANPREPLGETVGYLTDLLEADNGYEQRIQLRTWPRRGVEFLLDAMAYREAQYANALLYGAQGGTFGVPLWQYGSRLTAAVSPGASILPVDTIGIPWVAGDFALVWTDPWNWEAFAVQSIEPTHLHVTTGSVGSWPAGTLLVPIRTGRLAQAPSFSWDGYGLGSSRVKFLLDPRAAEAGTAPTAYLGLDVLDLAAPDRDGPLAEALEQRFKVLDYGTGALSITAKDLIPKPARSVRLTATTRLEAAALRVFVERRRGRAVPFWMPSYELDLKLAEDLEASTDLTALVHAVGYTEQMWAKGHGRRHLAIYVPGHGLAFRHVESATHGTGAATETLALDSALPYLCPAETTTVMFLKLCRLDTDDVTTDWLTGYVAESELAVRELPLEEPA